MVISYASHLQKTRLKKPKLQAFFEELKTCFLAKYQRGVCFRRGVRNATRKTQNKEKMLASLTLPLFLLFGCTLR